MLCDSCGCACAYGGRGVVAPMDVDDEEQQLAAPLLLDLEAAAAAAVGSKPPAAADDDHTTAKMAAVLSRIRVYWVFLFLLWVYLLNWARRFTLTFTDGSIWFTTFAVMVTAIPLTEFFYMLVMHVEETRKEEEEEQPAPPPPPAAANSGARERIFATLRDVFTTTDDDAASTEAFDERTGKLGRCILRDLN
uniref:Uncharacterized protein n=1 Tax=Oryza punctata TaxID=4537 RepID=A0A0E0MDC0_ORYPU